MITPSDELVIRFKMDLELGTGEFVAGASGEIRIDQERTMDAMNKAGIPYEKQLALSQHLMEEAWKHLARLDEEEEEEEEDELEDDSISAA
ncbi:hypothetical protein [Verrucomicrobium sp. BvORR034]|uniref:hypothetical protein n=1 Tax=Verrucomicrobium sp. BvORR034 TaxID=1396418 RepID=UPI0006796EFF|nr:hypothetical protein [Verrucomicrobium sp. BvORR034]